MVILAIHDKSIIREFLDRNDVSNFMYHCSNLESPFWENTQWYGLYNDNKLLSLGMFIIKYDMPVLLSTSYREKDEYQEELTKRLLPLLPKNLYSHLNIDTSFQLAGKSENPSVTKFFNMKLIDKSYIESLDTSIVQQLGEVDTLDIERLLKESHPEHLLDYEFISEGLFWGLRKDGRLVSLVGVSSKSNEYSCISIGNITTLPGMRRNGLASITTAALLKYLLQCDYQNIVLNVKQSNEAAVGCYKKLGFQVVGVFDEVIF